MDITPIEGQELSTVAFVQDYLQLEFSGPILTLYIWPVVFPAEGSYDFGEPGYRDALCAQIGIAAETATLVEGVALEIAFENGAIFRTSLRAEDYEGTEAGQFYSGDTDDELLDF
jgi:hypothetical protein